MNPLQPLVRDHLRPPRLGGRYVVVRLLGKGAQARVYLAWDLRLKQWRALKVLAADFIDDDHLKARFETEAHTMARLSHPNLMRVIDVDRDGKIPYIVMELARGGSLIQWMKRNGPMPPRMAVSVAMQCADGLQIAHEQGIVHRDVKPHNILIHENGRVVLTDFGIARVTDGELTATGSAMGTFVFMAPEQRTDAKSVDARADIYALGASFFTMLTQRTSSELFFAEARDELLEGVPEVLQPLVLTACKYERDQRYKSMTDFREALERRLAKLPPDAEDAAPLVEDVVLVPDETPPARLEPESHVEDLRTTLAAGGSATEEQPTFVVGTRPTGLTNPPQERSFEEMPTVMPYRMPDRLETLRRQRGMTDPPGKTPLPNDLPLYVENTPAPRVRTVPPPAPPPPPPEPEADHRVALLSFAVAAVAFLLIASVLGYGMSEKSAATAVLVAAETALTDEVVEQAGLVDSLEGRGADGAKLRQHYFAFEDAQGLDKVTAAVNFSRVVLAEAERVKADGIVESQTTQLRGALGVYAQAVEAYEEVQSSRAARLTGGLGLR